MTINTDKHITIDYFTDVLCVWAYLEQIRIDELVLELDEHVSLNYYFIPVFGNVENKMKTDWSDREGAKGYNQFIHKLNEQYNHFMIHPDIWVKNVPHSSTNPHLFLKAVQLLQQQNELDDKLCACDDHKTVFETALWRIRRAFFRDLIDISNLYALFDIAEELNLPVRNIENLIYTGVASASLDADTKLSQQYAVKGSPTMVFNEGRQMIYGNVGYREIKANIEELLKTITGSPGWC